jgi:hypothetical protein
VPAAPTPALVETQASAVPEHADDPPPPVPLALLAPGAPGALVIDVARLRSALDLGTIARWFVLELARIDLDDVQRTCGIDALAAVDRIVISGSALGGGVTVIEGSLDAERALDCLAAVTPNARAEPMGNAAGLHLGRQTWAVNMNGKLVMGAAAPVRLMLGVSPDGVIDAADPEAIALGLPFAQPVGDPRAVLEQLPRDADSFIVAANVASGSVGFEFPSITLRFGGTRERLELFVQADLSGQQRAFEPEEIMPDLHHTLRQGIAEALAGHPGGDALLRAVDGARIEQDDGKVSVTISLTEVDAFMLAANVLAAREIARQRGHQAPRVDGHIVEPAREIDFQF